MQLIKKIEDKLHKCKICDQVFPRKTLLVKHSVIHTNKKDLECPKCPFKSSKGFVILSHIRSHSNNFPFPCDKCTKKFRTQSVFTSHYKIAHLKMKPNQKIKCQYCDYQAVKGTVNVHEKSHRGEKPYMCSKCPFKFNRSWCLNEHYRKVHKYSKQDLLDAGMYTDSVLNRRKLH